VRLISNFASATVPFVPDVFTVGAIGPDAVTPIELIVGAVDAGAVVVSFASGLSISCTSTRLKSGIRESTIRDVRSRLESSDTE
jgi:hypothetical protein